MFNLGERVLPYLPSHAARNRARIVPALMPLAASTRPGDYYTNVQPETARKTPACYRNAYDAGAGYLGNPVGNKGLFASISPAQEEWYIRPTRGMKGWG